MSIEENKELVCQSMNEMNTVQGDISKLYSLYDKYYSPNYVYHNIVRGDMNREQVKQYFSNTMAAFPDQTITIEDMVAEGEKVVSRYTFRGTHNGLLMGVPSTGKQIAVKGVEIDKIADKKVVETWDFPDYLGMMTQLGVIPSIAPKK